MLYYLVLMHLSTTVPIWMEGEYEHAKCTAKAHERTTDDLNHDDAVLARHGFVWGCMTQPDIALYVRLNHCEQSAPVHAKAGGTAFSFECLGQ